MDDCSFLVSQAGFVVAEEQSKHEICNPRHAEHCHKYIFARVVRAHTYFFIAAGWIHSSFEFFLFTDASFLVFMWWIPLAVDTLLFALTSVRLCRLRRSQGRTFLLSRLLQIVWRDGMFYYLIICMVYVSNILNHSVRFCFLFFWSSGSLSVFTVQCGLPKDSRNIVCHAEPRKHWGLIP